jgi:Ca-activated chloride channel family protein
MTPDWNQFHLMRPEWLWALLPALILALLLWRAGHRSGGWSEVIAPELLPFLVAKAVVSRRPSLLPFVLLAWVLAALGASGPSWEKIPQPIHQKQDAMVLVLDLSYSMKAGDLSPSRLDRARQKLLDLLELRREGQTGLIAYAGDAHIVTPLTDDNPTIANLLPVLTPDMMPVPGSNTAAAIGQAIDLMHSAGISRGQIVLVTDGVDKKSRNAVEELLDGSGMALSILGVGTALGAPIPLLRGGFLKDESDTIVIPKLDHSSLQSLAAATGGRYLNIQIDDSDLDRLMGDPLLPTQEQTLVLDRTADTWDDQGYLLVLLLLPLVLPLFRRGWILCLLPMVLITVPESATAQGWDKLWYTQDQQGQRALQQGANKAAAELFENPEWAGTAAYRGDEFETAAKHFSEGDTGSDWYNRGNALAKDGQIDEAIEAYRESLARQPGQADAEENLALLEQLKQQQQEQQQNGENDEPQDNQDQQQSDEQGDPENRDSSDQSNDPQDGEQSPSDRDQEQQPPAGEDQPPDPTENEDSGQEEEDQPQDSAGEEEQEPTEQEGEVAQAEEASAEDQEEEQAMEQWLRRIPDDPSGLLREKFKYESQLKQARGDRRQNESYW